jgi:ankyrin repeat protein
MFVLFALAAFIAHLWFPPYDRLFYAIQSNQTFAVRAALLTGSSPDGCDYSSSNMLAEPSPPLASAVEQRNAAIVQALLEAGANPNFTFAEDVTPLEVALYRSSPDVIRLLLQHGADPLARSDQRTIVDAVTADGRAPMAAIVISYLGSTDPTWRTKAPHPVPKSCVYRKL